jgi:hypothetical protein
MTTTEGGKKICKKQDRTTNVAMKSLQWDPRINANVPFPEPSPAMEHRWPRITVCTRPFIVHAEDARSYAQTRT